MSNNKPESSKTPTARPAPRRKSTSRKKPTKSGAPTLFDSLPEAENQAIDAHEAASPEATGNGRLSPLVPKEMRQEYAADKSLLVAAEKHNLTHIYALESVTNDPEKRYFKIFMRSLLFLVILNKKSLLRTFTVHEDSDMTKPIVKGGLITIFGLDALAETMQSIGAVYDPAAFPDNPGIYGFVLEKPVTEQLIMVMKATLEAERIAANKTFTPKYTFVKLEITFQDIEATFTTLLRHHANFFNNKNRYAYDIAKDAADYFTRIYEDFRCVEDGVKSKKAFLAKFPEQISRLKVRLARAQRAAGMSIKQYARFGKLISTLEEQFETDFIKGKIESDES